MTSSRRPVSAALLAGLYDRGSPLSRLQGCPHIMARVWRLVAAYWREVVRLPETEDKCRLHSRLGQAQGWPEDSADSTEYRPQPFYLTPITAREEWRLPELPESWHPEEDQYSSPRDSPIDINMMPFLAEADFESCRLPESVRPYWGLIQACLAPEMKRSSSNMWNRRSLPSRRGAVCYLTIQESQVKADRAQRRPGLHVDSPGAVLIRPDSAPGPSSEGRGQARPYSGHHWGLGCCHYVGPGAEGHVQPGSDEHEGYFVLQGGIFLASSQPSSCRVWDCAVAQESVGRLGDVEHLREALPGPGLELEPGQLYWISDRTPHESLPLKSDAFRQFFRLVTSEVSLWYSSHSTPSPLGVLPDPAVTRVLRGDKFDPEGVQIVS